MSLRIATLLCLTALAACSNTTSEPAREPNQIASSTSSDGELRPASLDERSASATGADATSANDTTHRSDVIGPDASHGSHTPGSHSASPGTAAPGAASSPTSGSASNGSATAPAPNGGQVAPTTQPDNTKVNERDTNAAALTPIDQGNNEADLKMTQHIRQAVMANDSLSFTAKNVKIITNGGKVTLRGPVKTAAERDAIDAAARKIAGARVDNQIEVKK